MKTEIINSNRRNDWEQFIRENPHSIAWQSYDWSILLKKHYPMEFYPVAAYDGGKIRGILPLYRVKTSSRRNILMSVPYAVAGGIVADNKEAASALLNFAVDMSKKLSPCTITLKQYKVKMNGNLTTDDNYYNRELDMTEDINGIWDRIAETNRQYIEDAEKYNPGLEHPSVEVNIFFRLLLSHNHHRGIPCVSKKWIEDLITFGMYSIALMRHNNTVVAGTMIKEFKDTVSFPFTCIPDMSVKSRMFAYSLYWNLINKFAADGKRIFHSGRIPVTDEADDYRLGWGGTKHSYYYQYYPDNMTITEFSRKRGWKRDLFEKLWRRVPEPVAGALGPSIVKKFP
jgi:hypothetical protein